MGKYCMHCGAMLNEGEKFCSSCGASTEDAETITDNVVNTTQNNNVNNNISNDPIEGKTGTNPLAIASFVCSLVGLIFAGIWMGIIAISFSVTAKRQLKIYKNQKGAGLATAGLVLGILDLVFTILGLIIKAVI